jgi:hypothetical protein
MGRVDLSKNRFHAHLGLAGDLSTSHPESHEPETWPGISPSADLSDPCNSSWESAWIDLGGEG